MHEADNGLASFEHTDGGELKVRIRTPDEAATLRPDREVLKSETNSSIDHATQGQGMTILKIHAARVRQGDLTLYTTSMTVSDLMRPGFYSVETLDPANTNDKGFQRLLNTARAKKLADYIVSGQDSRDAFLPTSVFLATDKALPFDEHSRSLEINIQEVGAFSVVDGQHRLEGLRMAAEKDARVLSFEVPVNIAVDLPPIAQMCHFLIVNTTQKSVDKSVEQRIIKRLTDAIDVEDLPSLPKWISRTLDKGEIDQAIRYVDFLNETVDSPWYQKIEMANKPSATATVTQKTFVKALVKYVLTPNNPLTAYRDAEKERRIFLNYWKAIDGLLNDGNAAVLFKYNGVELFCKFSIPFFTKLQDKGDFTVKRMTEMLDETFKNVEGEYAGVGHPNWWASGSNASFLNAGAVNQVYHEMTRALHKGAGASTSELKL
jgi:DGQHR domain-containing protein